MLQAAAQQGLWALLFTALFWWVLRENQKREDRYLRIIETLGEEVKDRLGQLEDDVRKLTE